MTAFINADDVHAGRTETKAGSSGWHLNQRCPEELKAWTKGRSRNGLGGELWCRIIAGCKGGVDRRGWNNCFTPEIHYCQCNAIITHDTNPPPHPHSSQGTSFTTRSNTNKAHFMSTVETIGRWSWMNEESHLEAGWGAGARACRTGAIELTSPRL